MSREQQTPTPAPTPTAAAVAVAAAVIPTKRTTTFKRNFNGFLPDSTLVFTPTPELVALGANAQRYDLANIPGYAALGISGRTLLARAVSDELTLAFANTVKPTDDDPEGGEISEAVAAMSAMFAEITGNLYKYGRNSSGVKAITGTKLTAALMLAVKYGLTTQEAAKAHAHFEPLHAKLLSLVELVATSKKAADAIDMPIPADEDAPTDDEQTAIDAATVLVEAHLATAREYRKSYEAMRDTEANKALRAIWIPPKAKVAKKPEALKVTAASMFDDLGAAPI